MMEKQKQKQKQTLKTKLDQIPRRDVASSSSAEPARAVPDSEMQQRPRDRTLSFRYSALAAATNNFSDSNKIGSGGFGNVFKGTLQQTGQEVAVKKLNPNGGQGEREFLVEFLMLSCMRHENLVNLIGYCAEGDQRLVVYEYMPLRSVENRLHARRADQKPLDWITRMEIALGAAKGLEYLHNVANPPVIYRDLKTANILLDRSYKPKLSDFGLAKFGPNGDQSYLTARVMGTLGYCAPEYAKHKRLTLKADIYSFGVVLLELISGYKAMGIPWRGKRVALASWVVLLSNLVLLYKDNDIEMIVDSDLLTEGRRMESTLIDALELAITCVDIDDSARPTISEVVNALDYILEKIKRKQKKGISIGRGRGRGSEKTASTSRMVNDKGKAKAKAKEYDSDREAIVADSKALFAEKTEEGKKLASQRNEPPPSSSTSKP
ncbi:unnamed protein product [Microthlaspi erraticum]|uniref:Protein kinase domain-containing protein n=1 Tax=Microthlaspi erraticum TaxID=1685480 RepID=A0A6D2JRC3_9BRAS|nr:unnamed protein product [Microthlaspi erraticum]